MYRAQTVRLRKNYGTLCDFLIFINKNKEQRERKILNNIIDEGINILTEDPCNNSNKIKIIESNENREPKGFIIDESILNKIEKQYKKYKLLYKEKYNITLCLGTFYEMLIYLWCMRNFTVEDFQYINNRYIKGKWGFEIKESFGMEKIG